MSGGGGGNIIIRAAIKATLQEPLVHGNLPDWMRHKADTILAKDVNDWSDEEHHAVAWVFNWAAQHC